MSSDRLTCSYTISHYQPLEFTVGRSWGWTGLTILLKSTPSSCILISSSEILIADGAQRGHFRWGFSLLSSQVNQSLGCGGLDFIYYFLLFSSYHDLIFPVVSLSMLFTSAWLLHTSFSSSGLTRFCHLWAATFVKRKTSDNVLLS